MTSAALTLKGDTPKDQDRGNSPATASIVLVDSSVNLGNTSFSFTESLAPEQSANPLAVIFSERDLKMWLNRDGNHVSISNSDGGTNIRVVNERDGAIQLADALRLEKAPTSFVVSGDGKNILMVVDGGAYELTILPKGELKASFGYTPEDNREIAGVRYDDNQGIRISTRKV